MEGKIGWKWTKSAAKKSQKCGKIDTKLMQNGAKNQRETTRIKWEVKKRKENEKTMVERR